MEEITIRIGKDGKINLSVLGVKGESCRNLTKSLEKAMGSIESTTSTGEAYEQSATVEGEQTQSG